MIPLILAAAGAGKGMIDAKAAEKRQEKLDAFRKKAIQYSAWSGMGDPGYQDAGNQNMLSGAIGGGIKGYMLGSMGPLTHVVLLKTIWTCSEKLIPFFLKTEKIKGANFK